MLHLDTSGGCKFEKCCSLNGVLTLGLGKIGAGFVCEESGTGKWLELFFLNGIGICFLWSCGTPNDGSFIWGVDSRFWMVVDSSWWLPRITAEPPLSDATWLDISWRNWLISAWKVHISSFCSFIIVIRSCWSLLMFLSFLIPFPLFNFRLLIRWPLSFKFEGNLFFWLVSASICAIIFLICSEVSVSKFVFICRFRNSAFIDFGFSSFRCSFSSFLPVK